MTARPAPSRRVHDHEVHTAESIGHECRGHCGFEYFDVELTGRVPRGVSAGPAVSLHCKHRPAWAYEITHEAGKQPGSCIQIGHAVARRRFQPIQHGSAQDVRGAGMHLPEDARTDLEVAPEDHESQPFGSMSDAPVDNQSGIERRQLPKPSVFVS